VYYERSKDEKIDRKEKPRSQKKPRENEILNNQFHEEFFFASYKFSLS